MIKFQNILTEKKDPNLIQQIVKDVISNPNELNLSMKKSNNDDYFTVDRTKRGVITIYKTYWVDGKRHLKYLMDDWKEGGTYSSYMKEKGIETKVGDSGINPYHVWIELQFTQSGADVTTEPVDNSGEPVEDESQTEAMKASKEDVVRSLAKLIVDGVARSRKQAESLYLSRYGQEYADTMKTIEVGEVGKAIKLLKQDLPG